MKDAVNWDLELNEFVGQFGYNIEGLSAREVEQVENAIECACWEIDGYSRGEGEGRVVIGPTYEQNHGSIFDCVAAYVGGCFENNFNL